MDIEFHYYMTYLIAARAGFPPAEAEVIAHSAQSVDVNHVLIAVSRGTPDAYDNAISQTMDITRAHDDLRIYPVFHFIPGDPHAPSAARKDGVLDPWVTTPNSPLANSMLQSAFASQDLYRIGVSAHGYVDTWAHQNFIGRRDGFNSMPVDGNAVVAATQDVLDALLPIGHGAAQHKPDLPGLVWTDERLVADGSVIENRARFLDAAKHLFLGLAKYRQPAATDEALEAEAASLCADLNEDVGPQDDANALIAPRQARYLARAASPAYGGRPMPIYDDSAWFNTALNEDRVSVLVALQEKAAHLLGDYGDVVMAGERIDCTWRDRATYQNSAWYKFQEAVKSHLDECWDILTAEKIPGLS